MRRRGSQSGFRGLTVLEVVVLLAILVIIAMMVYPMLNKPDNMGPKEFTRSKMRRVEGHILNFYSEKKAWPEPTSWHEQLRPYFAQSRSFSPEDLVLDAWGKKFRYELKTVAADYSRTCIPTDRMAQTIEAQTTTS